ncbi:MAG: DNA-protecting protein DprA [Candidatus Omnitrophica bacterium]|nr:DNA-protecting protein DprA [Candidatus Omnitrophota bacterium]
MEIRETLIQQNLRRFGTRIGLDHALAEEIHRAEKAGVRIVTAEDEIYPELLRTLPDPPPVLYVKGTLLKEDEAAVALVGTRRATVYGLNTARHLARGLAQCGITVVSGLAEGIDGAGHEGALEAKGRTIAVLGHGLNHLFPSCHRKLAEKIQDSGALVSEFPMGYPPLRENFPMRNRVISGLSLGVLVVEAPLKSGALITAREALDQGREVFAVPGPVSSSQSQGTHRLIKDGAKLVEDITDILEELAPPLKERLNRWKGESPVHPEPPIESGAGFVGGLDSEELKIYEAIPVSGASMAESLSRQTALSPGRTLSLLTELEMKGWVKQFPGRGYSRK